MKKLLLLIITIFIFTENSNAQTSANGVTSYSCNIGTNFNNFIFRSALAIDNNGNKWIGFNYPSSPSYQLIRYNGTTWDSFPVIPGKKVNALAVDATNNLWIGTDSGLVMYNGSVFTKYNTDNSNIPSDTINCIATGGGKIYAGTNHGLAIFNGTSFTNYNHAQNGLSHDTIYSITYESSTAIWIGNIGGLEKFYGLGFTYWFSLGNVGSDKVNCIYIDQQNNKWLGTNTHGVVKFDNLNFYTMQQLFGQYAIIGGAWPTQTNSICKGPNGGVSFVLLSMNSNVANSQGLIEILNNNSTSVYNSVGYTYTNYNTYYSIFQYDASSNKIFFINAPNGSYPWNVFLYSFDVNQYTNNPFPIQPSNSAYLDINNVSALISSNDNMGWDGSDTKYFVPKTANSSPLHNSALWIGGYNNGILKTAVMTYRQNGTDFWPGPLDTIHDSIDVNTVNLYNKVWKVNRYDIANYIYNWQHGNVQNGTYMPANSILTWPGNGTGSYAHNLAPYVDVNSNGIYDPIHDGDYPLIKGDQMIWHVFNDRYDIHRESGGGAFGIEVQASAYAFVCPNIADSNRVLNYTTFYNYKIINRSQNEYDSCIIANWVDSDLGDFLDDYVGCDVMNNYGYVYNGDYYDEDANGMTGYHENLPAFTCNILSGPIAKPNDGIDNNNNGVIDEPNEKCLMSSFNYYTNTGDLQTGNPTAQVAIQYFNFINGKWRNGTPITFGANGCVLSNPACRHLFPGNTDPYGISIGGSIANPIAPPINYGAPGWTEYTANVVKNDMRFMTGSGQFTMYPGGTYEIDYAFVFSQDSTNCNGDTAALGFTCVLPRAQQDNIRVRNWFNANNFPSCLSLNGVSIQQNIAPQLEVSVYPNPASNYLYIEFKNAKEKTTIEIFDLLGNLVKAGTFYDAQKYISIPVDDLQSGMYSVRIKTGNSFAVKKFVKE